MALDIQARIEEFKPYIPLIQGLRNPGMRTRHWDMLSNEININVRPKANLTFTRCLEMNLQDHTESISKVAEVAGKEYAIEQVGRHQQARPAPPTCCPMVWEGDSTGPHPWGHSPGPEVEVHPIKCVNNAYEVLGMVSTIPIITQLFLLSYSSLRKVLMALPHLTDEQIKAQRGSAISQGGIANKGWNWDQSS